MIEIPATIKIGVAVMATAGAGLLAESVVSESTPMTIGLVILVGGGIMGGIWTVGRLLQRLEDGQGQMKREIKEIKVKLKILNDEDTDK